MEEEGKPAVQLVAVEPELRQLRPAGGHYAAEITTHDNFDAPLPEDLMQDFE
jgi:hypothetical protein